MTDRKAVTGQVRVPSTASKETRAIARLAALCAAMLLSGCTASRWESDFVSSGVSAPARSGGETAPVRIREVPWDRLQATLAELQSDRTASDVHPDDWTAAQKREAKTKLLRGLQLVADPRNVDVLGRSEFRTTDYVRSDDGSLAKFARKLGATTVVWSSTYLGTTEVVRSEPVTEFRSGTFDRWHDGRRRGGSFSESSTIFVPVKVQADERVWVAYFLREYEAPELPR